MSDEPKDPGDEGYEVGYGKPPPHRRFRKGQSGNPGGRPRGITGGRAMKLVVKEAYRMVRVKEGDRVLSIPALAAVVRSLIALAAKGNGPAQRVFPLVEQAEQTCAVQPVASDASKLDKLSERDIARRIALILVGAVPPKPVA
jgi:Family of unknown function (DUF5681)